MQLARARALGPVLRRGRKQRRQRFVFGRVGVGVGVTWLVDVIGVAA